MFYISTFLLIFISFLHTKIYADVPLEHQIFIDDLELKTTSSEVKIVANGINDYAENGYTKLMIAALSGDLEGIRKLLELGGDPNLQTKYGDTALLLAIQGGFYYPSMQLIKAKNINLNHSNNNGMNALILAITANNEDIAISLLDNDADPNIFLNDGTSALIVASNYGLISIVDKLLKYNAKVNFRTKAGETALMFASATGHINVIEKLIINGADIDTINTNGYNALIFAALRGNSEVIELLLKHGSAINVKDKYGTTALEHCIDASYQQCIDILVIYGANLPKSGYRVTLDVMNKRKEYLMNNIIVKD